MLSPKLKFVSLNYETIVDIRDAKWFVYIRMPLYPSISIILQDYISCLPFISGYSSSVRHILTCKQGADPDPCFKKPILKSELVYSGLYNKINRVAAKRSFF